MIAPQYAEVAARIRKRAFFHVFDPGAENAYRYFMLFFTRNRAGVAADTSILIDDESKILSTHIGPQDFQAIRTHSYRAATSPAWCRDERSTGEGLFFESA